MITIDEARTRVTRGAAHLDIVRPGWEGRIDVGTLCLKSCWSCVIGQLFTAEAGGRQSFGYGIQAVGWFTRDDCVEHGVAAGGESALAEFAVLQDCWIEAIAMRLHPDPLADPVSSGEAVAAR